MLPGLTARQIPRAIAIIRRNRLRPIGRPSHGQLIMKTSSRRLIFPPRAISLLLASHRPSFPIPRRYLPTWPPSSFFIHRARRRIVLQSALADQLNPSNDRDVTSSLDRRLANLHVRAHASATVRTRGGRVCGRRGSAEGRRADTGAWETRQHLSEPGMPLSNQ